MGNRKMVLRQNVMWEQKAVLRLGFIHQKILAGAHQLSRNLVWHNVVHLEEWEALASPKWSTTDPDTSWLFVRVCQKILGFPCTLWLLKWLLLKIPWWPKIIVCPEEHSDTQILTSKINRSHDWFNTPSHFRGSRGSCHQGRTPNKTPGIGDSGIGFSMIMGYGF